MTLRRRQLFIALATFGLLMNGCSNEGNRSGTVTVNGQVECPVMSIEYAVAGPPNRPTPLEVDNTRLRFRDYDRGSYQQVDPKDATLEDEEWLEVQRLACAELKRKPAPEPTGVVGNSLFLTLKTNEGSQTRNISGDDLSRVPLLAELNRLTKKYFNKTAFSD